MVRVVRGIYGFHHQLPSPTVHSPAGSIFLFNQPLNRNSSISVSLQLVLGRRSSFSNDPHSWSLQKRTTRYIPPPRKFIRLQGVSVIFSDC